MTIYGLVRDFIINERDEIIGYQPTGFAKCEGRLEVLITYYQIIIRTDDDDGIVELYILNSLDLPPGFNTRLYDMSIGANLFSKYKVYRLRKNLLRI
jgi:hypothetical protein